MDKLLSRALRAHNQAVRRAKRIAETKKKRELNETRREHTAFQSLLSVDRRTSRTEEKEDYRLGPLRPRRAVGKTEINLLGAFDQSRIIPPAVPEEHRIKHWNIVVKDRVVLLRGPDRHKIGVVKSVDKNNNSLLVEGLNMMPLKVPEVFLKLESNQPPVVNREAPIHYNDVRLVIPQLDPETNTLKDTIVANIEMSRVFYDKREGTRRWKRYIKGTRTEIPWPEKEESEKFDQPGDTRIMDVEHETYIPTLLKPPFPLSIVDELRNKYSKFRTRHEQWYIEKVEAQEKEKAEKAGRRVHTPLQLLNKKIREERKAKGPPVLSSEVMEHIGKVMVQNRPELLQKVHTEATA